MKVSRKIAHAVADIILKSAHNCLEKDRLRKMYSSAASLNGSDHRKSEEILNAWVDCIVNHLLSKKDSIISDYILDMIQNIEKYLESNFTENDLNEFALLLDNPILKKFVKDEGIFKIIADAKESFSSTVFKEIHSEECAEEMQKRLKKIFAPEDFDDNFYTSG